MANKWKTTTAAARWVKELYSNEPINPSAQVLVRAQYGISRTATKTLIDALDNSTTVTNPTADNVTYSGTWRIIKNEARPVNDGALSGSDTIVQTLGQGFFTTLTASNLLLLKTLRESEEQNENAWMYYQRAIVIESSRWINLTEAACKSLFPYESAVTMSQTLTDYDDPVIVQNWYEKEQDGSYSMYRTLLARALLSAVKYRAIQYGGMVLVDTANLPVEGDDHIHITGLRRLTETIYSGAKLTIGGETYRVTANTTAAAGAASISVAPEVTATLETYCDTDDGHAVQVYFEALT